ncbi:thioredoxin [Planctobacterium marinum]|uniref:Thioredoxin n=1 Tax=Planctobacterium marinum TaxID=1631968 RepID=A0AA48KV42_9ALTE|nr:hypothetical protein MACH26_26360 [Planctobacterium marinum]
MFCKINKDLSVLRGTITALRCLAILLCFHAPLGWGATSDVPDSVGYVQVSDILTHYPDFRKNYEEYTPDEKELALMGKIENRELLVMFGTWCHDSEREIPILLKLLDESGVKLEALTLLAVDRNKREPTGKAEQWRLKYTPTIVLKSGENELGRIIEKPKVSLAADLAKMLN